MNLTLKSFSQLVQDMGAALQSSATALVDVSVGSISRAIIEANAGIALWMQWLILQVLQMTRASTSVGADLDSWMADFGLVRLPASASVGEVTFFRFSTNLPASIPVGTAVKTGDGTLTFNVVGTSSLSTWNPGSNSYVIPQGVSSLSVPAECNSVGIRGNVVAGSISIIASSLPGIDQVSNANTFTNGQDAETDDLFRARFTQYLAGLSRATPAAVRSAAASVRQGLSLALLENTAADGSPFPGHLLLVIDDGSGTPSSALIQATFDAVDKVRPVGTSLAVIGPGIMVVNVALTISAPKDNSAFGQLASLVQRAVESYLSTLDIGRMASVSRVIQAAYSGHSAIENVTDVVLNGNAQDIIIAPMVVIKPGRVSVVINGT